MIIMCVSSKILALSHFFFDLVKFGNTWCVVRCCPRSTSSIFPACVSNCLLSHTVTPIELCTPKHFISTPLSATLSFNPWTSPNHPYLPPYPDRPTPPTLSAEERPHQTSRAPPLPRPLSSPQCP